MPRAVDFHEEKATLSQYQKKRAHPDGTITVHRVHLGSCISILERLRIVNHFE